MEQIIAWLEENVKLVMVAVAVVMILITLIVNKKEAYKTSS